jgi:hypothetical protein
MKSSAFARIDRKDRCCLLPSRCFSRLHSVSNIEWKQPRPHGHSSTAAWTMAGRVMCLEHDRATFSGTAVSALGSIAGAGLPGITAALAV